MKVWHWAFIGAISCGVAMAQTPPAPQPPQPPAPQPSAPPAGSPGKSPFALPTEETVDDGPEEMPVAKPKAAAPAPAVRNVPLGGLGERPVTDGVMLQALDKVTARVTRLDVGLDQTVSFGTLRITARACAMRPPEEPPESTAFLEITDTRGNPQGKPVFSGWMFASTPALSALEHPVYDVWVNKCRTASSPARPGGGLKK